MANVTITVEGLQEIERALGEFGLQVDRKVIREGLRAGAEVYREGMSARAPEHTGLLRSSITVKIKIGTREVEAEIGPSIDAFYGSFVELGTRFKEPNAFMRPTLFEDGPAAIAAFAHAATEVLAEVKVK